MGIEYGAVNLYSKYGQPSLDLQFSGPKGSLKNRSDNGAVSVEFTRTQDTPSSYYKSDGTIGYASTDEARFDHDPVTGESLGLLIEEERTNVITYSEYFTNAYWTKNISGNGVTPAVTANATTAPDGTLTADRIDFSRGTNTFPNLSYVSSGNISTVQGSLYSGGIWVKAATNTDVGKKMVLRHVSNGAGIIHTLTSDWKRIDSTETALSTSGKLSFGLLGYYNSAYGSQTQPETSISVYVWGAQLETGAFPTSYIPTPATFTSRASTATYYDANGVIQTAAIDEARDDAYFPDENGNFISAGLLLEEERTNLVTYSEDLGNWSSTLWTITTDAIAAPDGNTTADLAVPNLGTSTQSRSVTVSVTAGVQYVATIFAKAKEMTSFNLRPTGSNSYRCTFTLTGSGTAAPLNGSGSITALPNGWYKCVYAFTEPTGGSRQFGVQTEETSDGVSGFYVWGAQLEEGSYPTSYIPTTGSTVTRAADISSSGISTRGADVASMTGTNFSSWYNQSEGTIFTRGKLLANNINGDIVVLDSNNTVERIQVRIANTQQLAVRTGNVNQALLDAGSVLDSFNSIAGAMKVNDFACALNGALATDNAGNVASPFQMRFFLSSPGGHISRITYWPTRLSDSDLQRLTE